jgi:hypothetical protein
MSKIASASLLLVVYLIACSSNSSSPSPPAVSRSPILSTLNTLSTVGSVVDPANGDQNPYGLAPEPTSVGTVVAGDLIVCDFNDGPTNTQGHGTTILGIHPTPGSTPYHIAQSPALQGCNAVAALPDGSIVSANLLSGTLQRVVPGQSPVALAPSGFIATGPWGMIYAASFSPALYESNEADGSIYRLPVNGAVFGAATRIATGFSSNRGVPGTILAPSGLTYDPAVDTLYVVDGNVNTIYGLAHVSQIGADGVVVNGSAVGGPSSSSVRIIASGPPLNGPISAALLANGNLVVGNTLDPDGTNLLLEVSTTAGGVVATKNVDQGAAGALFGIATTGSAQTQKIYFNDDNSNSLNVLSP